MGTLMFLKWTKNNSEKQLPDQCFWFWSCRGSLDTDFGVSTEVWGTCGIHPPQLAGLESRVWANVVLVKLERKSREKESVVTPWVTMEPSVVLALKLLASF